MEALFFFRGGGLGGGSRFLFLSANHDRIIPFDHEAILTLVWPGSRKAVDLSNGRRLLCTNSHYFVGKTF